MRYIVNACALCACALWTVCIVHSTLCIVHCVHWMQPAFSAAPSPQAPLVPYQMHIYLM